MSRSKKGGKPLGWEYWGKRKGGSWVDRKTSHKIERMQFKEEDRKLIEEEIGVVLGKVKFTGKGGYDGENKHANSILSVGEEYECDGVNVGSWSSEYHLVGLGWYNTVMFEDEGGIFDNAVRDFWSNYYVTKKNDSN